ncbi:GntR family transcriptional regulator [Gordonia sp. NPDC058843]|uniref:GntR family transcriptional regulator n=1 Tax=Gordonia sp. NPDC058843 TaxID=3346648 RepID=UPI0036841B7E
MASAGDAAYDLIRSRILSGEYVRGRRLREELLASEAGVSRTPVREALRRLEAEGLVEFLPRRGARVSGWTGRELEDLYEIRALLEGYGARAAADRITADELSALCEIADQMEALTTGGESFDTGAVTELNSGFHGVIVRATKNAQLEHLVRSVMDLPLVHQTFTHYSSQRVRASNIHHRELIEALRSGNGTWAESVMRSHILAAGATVRAAVEDEEPADSR